MKSITPASEDIFQESLMSWSNNLLSSFIISVIASVVGYYICKWLDGDE